MSYESLVSSTRDESDLSGLGQSQQQQGLGQRSLTEILKKLDVVNTVGGGKSKEGKESSAAAAAAHVGLAVLTMSEQWRRYEALLPDDVIRFGEKLNANYHSIAEIDQRDDDSRSEL